MSLGCTAALSACGGGGGGAPATTSKAITPAPTPREIVIDANGDSTIYGLQIFNGAPRQSPNNAPVLLQADLGDGVAVINHGVPGSQAKQAIAGTEPYYSTPLAGWIGADGAQIVIGNWAINDSVGSTTNEYAAALTEFVQAVRAAGKTPILEEPNPVCDISHSNLDAYVSIMRTVAQQQNVPLIHQYDYVKSLTNWQAMLSDCVHPTDALYALKAQREADIIGPIVEKLH